MEEKTVLPARNKVRQRALVIAWVSLLVVLGIGIAWQVYRLLPGWIENSVQKALFEKGIVVTDFPVGRIGYDKMVIDEGGLVLESHALSWDSIWVNYGLSDALEGRVGNIRIDAPVLLLHLPDPVDVFLVEESTDAFVGDALPLAADSAPTITVTTPVDEVPTPVDPDGGLPGEPSVEPAPVSSIWDQLQGLPVGLVEAPAGVIEIQLLEEIILSMEAEARMEKQPFGMSGEFFVGNLLFSSHVSLRAPATNPVLTLQGELAMPNGGLKELASRFSAFAQGPVFPQIVSSGKVSADFLFEIKDDDPPYGSTEISVDEVTLQFHEGPFAFTLSELILAGAYKKGALSLQMGAEFLFPDQVDIRLEPFRFKASLVPEAGASLETDSFGWDIYGFSGSSALRGSATGSGEKARLECAFSEIAAEWIHLEPFSVLFEHVGNDILAKASPIGAKKADTLWIEDFQAVINPNTFTSHGEFTWYNAFGLHMGMVGFSTKGTEEAFQEAQIVLNEPGKNPFLTGDLKRNGMITEIKANGVARLSWLNSLNTWWGGLPASFEGEDPLIKAQLSGFHPIYSGNVDVGLRDVSVALDGGLRIEKINGEINLSIQGLPHTTVPQHLSVGVIESGQFVLSDISLEWALPSLRQFEVKQFEAFVGSGKVSLDPFVVDLLEPVVKTQLHIDSLEGNKLLEWLDETRFSIEGTVSGHLTLGWVDGTFVLGEGTFKLDSGVTDGRFVFSDPSFLKERFAAFGGVPLDLKERFLQALLEEGITIHSMEASLGPARESGKILLRMAISGESKTELLEVPIEGFIINNVISGEDLGRLLGLIGPVRFVTSE